MKIKAVSKNIDISVIIIAYNEERNIGECIESIAAQKFDGHFEIVVIDDRKTTDKTAEVVKKYMHKFSNVKYFMDMNGSNTFSRNLGIKKSKYGYIAFTDADCVVPKDWLQILKNKYVEYQKTLPNLAGVGGANIMVKKDANTFMQALDIASDSFIGSLGSIQARAAETDKAVFSLSCTNSLYDKNKVIKVGMFPQYRQHMGDDWGLGLGLKKNGYALIAVKKSFVWHKFRSSPKRFWKNMMVYGDVRMYYIKNYFKYNNPKYFLSFAFIIAFLSVFLSFIHPVFMFPLLYFPAIFLYSTYLSIKKNRFDLSLMVFMVYVLLHFGYCAGEIRGLKWFFVEPKR